MPACSNKKSGLMLAINTDMKAPKDVNAVSVTVLTNNAIKHNVIGRVTPQGDILLPATLAIAEPDDPNASIRIRVMAFQERKARVLRDVRTSIPPGGRVALLRIPLNFVNDGSTKGGPDLAPGVLPAPNPGTVVSTPGGDGGTPGGTDPVGSAPGTTDLFDPTVYVPDCPNPEHTWIDGECHDAYVDPESLPEFHEGLVGSPERESGQCFDVRQCFGSSVVLGAIATTGDAPQASAPSGSGESAAPAPDAGTRSGADGTPIKPFVDPRTIGLTNLEFDMSSCSLRVDATTDISKLNLAIVTPDTGECIRPGECYIPIDQGAGGWTAENGLVKFPSYVCKLVQGKKLRIATSTTCVAKKESSSICIDKAPSTSDKPPTSSRDSGAIDVSPAAATFVMPEDFASSVTSDGANVYIASAHGVAKVAINNPIGQQMTGVPPEKAPWRIEATPAGLALTKGQAMVFIVDPNGQVRTLQGPAEATFNYGTFIKFANTFYFTAQGPSGSGGIYEASSSVEPILTKKGGFQGAPVIDNAMAIASWGNGFVYGNSAGEIRGCDLQFNGCGAINPVGSGGVYTFGQNLINPRIGYAIIGGSLWRNEFIGTNGVIQPTLLVEGGVDREDVEGLLYPHALASNGQCVFFSNHQGLAYVHDGTSVQQPTLLHPANAGMYVMGVALAPAPDGLPSVYFTMYGPKEQQGGLWRIPIPQECGGTGPIVGGEDAGVTPAPDAGLNDAGTSTDASKPDGGVITDGGSGGADAGAMDAMICKPTNISCLGPDECCSFQCIGNKCL